MDVISILSSEFCLQQKAQLFHWNVRGPNFNELHGMFGGQYEKLVEIVDTLAEQVRQSGDLAPMVSEMLEETSIKPESMASSWEEKVKDLRDSHRKMMSVLTEAIEDEKEEALKNVYIDLKSWHKEQAAWKLDSHLTEDEDGVE